MAKKLEKPEQHESCSCGDCRCGSGCCAGKVLITILTILWVAAAIMACFYSFKTYQLNALSAWGTENMNKMIEMYKSDAYIKQATERTDSQISSFNNQAWDNGATWETTNNDESNTETESFGSEWTLTADKIAELKVNGVVYGPSNAKITILEFADASCGYCQRQIAQDRTVDNVMAQYPNDVNLVFKNFPIFNETAAEAMACSEDYLSPENYHSYVVAVFSADDVTSVDALANLAANYGADASVIANCINNGQKASEVSATMSEGQSFDITGTPSSVIINNESGKFALVPGAYPLETFVDVINNLLS